MKEAGFPGETGFFVAGNERFYRGSSILIVCINEYKRINRTALLQNSLLLAIGY